MARDVETELYNGSPYAQYQRVEVTFPTTPDTDIVVKHNLSTVNPDDVEYQLLTLDRAGVVYHDHSASRRPWGSTFLVLRCNTASLKATLLLTVPRK